MDGRKRRQLKRLRLFMLLIQSIIGITIVKIIIVSMEKSTSTTKALLKI